MYVNNIIIETKLYVEFLIITKQIEALVKESGIQNGLVTVQTKHTTTGIAVNESLECLLSDMEVFLARLVPEEEPYSHARMLHSYGSTAGNPTGHLKAHLTGNHCHLLLQEGEIVKGFAQEVFLCEFDGPSKRTVMVIIEGN